ncbi:class I SAM-dependent methyltransferase [Marinobacter orientalis]|uniref:Class I SAM-dependent methyltransferase n=1 Tax=Marinobacter orientalis TaxID=1928859 RepID=A0A7Y0REE2_9GAMM|nr:class I SAM-dependent methyltransferase [Marinobacter orientalis]NMT64712.1 class I SAM-dependent methyltransferase [Marinobacter orientalis]TGX48253.1 class I SAM-dependent methyltransferase [Marinobacter orientalis]
MNTTPSKDSSGISFTALYTGAVWHRHGLSDDVLATDRGRWLYHLMTPFEAASKAFIGGNIRTFLLQRHLIIDHLIEQALEGGVTQVLEIACGMSPRGIRLRDRHPQLHMVEADLPDMATRKAARLLVAGRLGANHQIMPVDILAASGEQTIEAVVERAFDNNEPMVVVTEGLTSYFSLPVISEFWQRLARLMQQRPGSVYLCESYLMPGQPLLRGTLKALGGLLGSVTRSDVSFHFMDDQQATEHLTLCGFPSVAIHNPADYYDRLPIPESRNDPMVRVIEAWP